MAKKPPKSKSRRLEFGSPHVISRPPGSRPADLIRAMNDAVITGRMPSGWEVETTWRNGKNGAWKSAPIEKMLADSANRGGDFNSLFLNRFLALNARRFGVEIRQPREATEAEIEAFEDQSERIAEKESGEFAALRKKQKRSAASKRGALTRARRKAEALRREKAEAEARKLRAEARKRAAIERQRAAEAAARKRSEAARKGWETRRQRAAEKLSRKAKKTKGKKR